MTEDALDLDYGRSGRVDARQVLGAFADGRPVAPVFGPDSPAVASSIASYVRGITPTRDEVIAHAWGYGNPRRIRAYVNGRAHLLDAYHGYTRPEDFPDIGTLGFSAEGEL